MARKKVKLAWIASDSARRACFRKRREGLFKKVMELSTLCGVEAAAVVFCPDEEAAFWPSKASAEQLFRRYEEVPAMERSKKMLNQENFMKDRLAKIKEQTKRCLKKSQEMEMNDLVHQIVIQNRMCELPISDLVNLVEFLGEKHGEISRRAHHLRELPPLSGVSGNLHVGNSDIPVLPISATNSDIPEIAEDDIWLPFRNIRGGSGTGGIQLESLPGSPDFFPSGGNQMGLQPVPVPVPAPDISDTSWIADLLMAGNQLGMPDGNTTTAGVTVSVGNEAGLPVGNICSSTGGLVVGNEMGQRLTYEDVATELLPGLANSTTTSTGEKLMELPQEKENINGRDGGGNYGGVQLYDDVNYEAWFESLGV